MNSAEWSHALLDRCLKVLTRRAYHAVFRLFREEVDPTQVRFENVALNLPEYRADDLLVVETSGPDERWALLLEVQSRPDPALLRSWRYKAAAAELVLKCDVVLAVLYLEQGDYATFPSSAVSRGRSLKNTFEFEAVRLWEHADRIADGELPELAPLLLLAVRKKTEAVLQHERKLILELPISPELRRDLLAVATMIGTRYFDGETLRRIFREEMAMLKEVGFIQEWIEEGEARGEVRASREALGRALTARFGPLRPDVQARLDELSAQQCLELLERAVTVGSLQELGF
jgi:predicted transposase YdaD